MEKEVSIGVVVPYCNDFQYIEECLVSIDNQTVTALINVYLVDDYSEDSIRLADFINAHKFHKLNLIYVRNEKRLGGGGTRNVGINLSCDDYIAFMDADDFWLKEKLEIQLSQYINDTIQCTKSYKGPSFEQSSILPKKIKMEGESVSEALFCSNKLLQTSTFFMSTHIAKNISFNQKLPRHQDYDFLLRAENYGYLVIQIDEPLTFWRVINSDTSRFVKKNATAEFFVEWYMQYKDYMSTKARVAYCSKNIFSACFVTKKLSLYFRFIFNLDSGTVFKMRVFLNIILWRFTKLWRKLF